MKNNTLLGYILSVIIIMIGGFALFNVAFIVFAFIVNFSISILGADPQSAPPVLSRILGLAVLFAFAWFGLKIQFKSETFQHTFRSMLLTMPLMVILVAMGVLLHQQAQWLIMIVGALIIVPSLYYVWKKKLPWMYTFAILYVSILALYVMFSGMDI